jgi:hypothetical protein
MVRVDRHCLARHHDRESRSVPVDLEDPVLLVDHPQIVGHLGLVGRGVQSHLEHLGLLGWMGCLQQGGLVDLVARLGLGLRLLPTDLVGREDHRGHCWRPCLRSLEILVGQLRRLGLVDLVARAGMGCRVVGQWGRRLVVDDRGTLVRQDGQERRSCRCDLRSLEDLMGLAGSSFRIRPAA